MRIFALLIALAAFAAAPAASAAGGPPQYAQQGGTGVSTLDGKMHFVAIPAGDTTLIESIAGDGSVWSFPSFKGSWGIPMITYRDPAGLSRDGRTLVVQTLAAGSPTSFLVLEYAHDASARAVHAEGQLLVRCAVTGRVEALSDSAGRREELLRATSCARTT